MSNKCRLIFLLILLTLIFTTVSAPGNFLPEKDVGLNVIIITPDKDDSLSVSGTSKFISFDDIKILATDTIPVKDRKSKKYFNWEGVYLRDVFNKYLKINWQDIQRLTIKAPDGYSSVISGKIVTSADNANCAFNILGEQKWSKKYGYMRIIYPDLHEMHWINKPSEIKIILNEKRTLSSTWKFQFFDCPNFQQVKEKSQAGDDYWFINDILAKLGSQNHGFTIFSRDGHLREYAADEIIPGFI